MFCDMLDQMIEHSKAFVVVVAIALLGSTASFAYVLGYKVTKADMALYVIPVISASDICINPVNWQTDATPATLHDTITVTVAPSHHVLVVNGYSGSEYAPYKGFLNVGDIHSCEPWLYSECLAKNIKVRAKEWRIQYYE